MCHTWSGDVPALQRTLTVRWSVRPTFARSPHIQSPGLLPGFCSQPPLLSRSSWTTRHLRENACAMCSPEHWPTTNPIRHVRNSQCGAATVPWESCLPDAPWNQKEEFPTNADCRTIRSLYESKNGFHETTMCEQELPRPLTPTTRNLW